MKYIKYFESNFIVTNEFNIHKGKFCLHQDFGYLYIIDNLELGYWNNNMEQDSKFKSYQLYGDVFNFLNPRLIKAGPHHFSDDVEIMTPQEMFNKHIELTLEIYEKFKEMPTLSYDSKEGKEEFKIWKRFLDNFREINNIDSELETLIQSKKYNI